MSSVRLEVVLVGLSAPVAGVFTFVAVPGVSRRGAAGRDLGAGGDGDAGGVACGAVSLCIPNRSSAVLTGLLVESAVPFVACFGPALGRSAGSSLGAVNSDIC